MRYHPRIGRTDVSKDAAIANHWMEDGAESIGTNPVVFFMSQQQISRWLSMADVSAKKSVAKQVLEKVHANECLICGQTANGNRGLCVGHALKFYRAQQSLPKAQRAAFEEGHIREGRILAAGELRQIRDPNPFTVTSEQ